MSKFLMKHINKYILPLLSVWLLTLFLQGCAIFGTPTDLDDTKGWQADRIYQAGEEKMQKQS